jgi:hypothetical protein
MDYRRLIALKKIYCMDCNELLTCERIDYKDTSDRKLLCGLENPTKCICLPCYIKRGHYSIEGDIKKSLSHYISIGCWSCFKGVDLDELILAVSL